MTTFRWCWLFFPLPAENMARLAEEVCECKAQLLSGGLSGNNATAIVTHLWDKQPVLIPYPPRKKKKKSAMRLIISYLETKTFLKSIYRYDEDFNHEPCRRGGYRAHWAVVSGEWVIYSPEVNYKRYLSRVSFKCLNLPETRLVCSYMWFVANENKPETIATFNSWVNSGLESKLFEENDIKKFINCTRKIV